MTKEQWEARHADAHRRVTEAQAELARLGDEYVPPPPVDRMQRQLLDGSPVPADHSHTKLRDDGMQEGYIVLTPEERAKGFVRPYRDAYKHAKCGAVTTMGRALSETYARDPSFYNGTFCATCRQHFPLDQFTWAADGQPVGS